MDAISYHLEMKELNSHIKACGDAIAECQEVIHNSRFLLSHIKKFGISPVLQDMVGPDTVITEEGLLEKIKTMGRNLHGWVKKRMDAIRNKLAKKQAVQLSKYQKAINDLEELSKVLKATDFNFDPKRSVKFVPAPKLLKIIEFINKLCSDLGSTSLIKQNSSKIEYWDIERFKADAAKLGINFSVGKKTYGMKSYVFKSAGTVNILTDNETEGSLEEHGWNRDILIKIIQELLKGYEILETRSLTYKNMMHVYANNMDIYEKTSDELGEDSSQADDVNDMMDIADTGNSIVEDILFRSENFFINAIATINYIFSPKA